VWTLLIRTGLIIHKLSPIILFPHPVHGYQRALGTAQLASTLKSANAANLIARVRLDGICKQSA